MAKPGEPYDDLDAVLDRALRASAVPDEDADEKRWSLVTKLVSEEGVASRQVAADATVPISVPVRGTKLPPPSVRRPGDSIVLEALTTGMLISDADGIIRSSSRAARRMLGVTEGTIGGSVFDLFEPTDRDTVARLLDGAFHDRVSKEVDLVACGKQGPVPARVAATGRHGGDRTSKEAIWTLRDSGPSDPSLEVRLQGARTEVLAELGLDLAREIGPIARRLSEALLSARGALDHDSNAAASVGPIAARFTDAAAELLRLELVVAELERFASMPPLRVEPVDPAILVARAETLLSRSLKAHRIHVRNEMDDPAPMILADSARLTEILVNLIRNARNAIVRKFGEGGEPAPTSARRVIVFETFVKAPWVILSVTNNGIAIPASEVERVFLPRLVRAEARRSWAGLPETAALVKLMGGAVRCQSLEDEGTRFILTFRKADS